MLTYSDLPKLSSKQFQSRFSAYRKKNCKNEWKPIYYNQEILLDITDFCETLADTNDWHQVQKVAGNIKYSTFPPV